jgi:transcription-repair coupling factor (superfamily II helicase)
MEKPLASTALLTPAQPTENQSIVHWRPLMGSGLALTLAELVKYESKPVLVITPDHLTAERLVDELSFFQGQQTVYPVYLFNDWEILPYDHFSPNQDIISRRLKTLYDICTKKKFIVVVAVATLLHRLFPKDYLLSQSFVLKQHDSLDMAQLRAQLEQSGYRMVAQVMEHGEYAVRGAILDLYPMGHTMPYRIEFDDDIVASLRTFDLETQRSIEVISNIDLLPAREFPFDDASVSLFRDQWRQKFDTPPQHCPIYNQISEGLSAAVIEYYFPLFFNNTQTLFDYLPKDLITIIPADFDNHVSQFWHEINQRYQQYGHDRTRPLLPPEELFLTTADAQQHFKQSLQIIAHTEINNITEPELPFVMPPKISVAANSLHTLSSMQEALAQWPGSVLLTVETAGRKQILLELLNKHGIHPVPVADWSTYLATQPSCAITLAPLEIGCALSNPAIWVLPESELSSLQVIQRKRQKQRVIDPDSLIKNLAELSIGAPVVHVDHGVGRYQGLQTLPIDDDVAEFLTIEYLEGTRVYVPVANLHLITRYVGAAETAPLNRLGSDQWSKAKQKALERVKDIAAQLLEIYAKRKAAPGFACQSPDDQYETFCSAFPFEETPDQQQTITAVIADMCSDRVMDRLVCGDVGFGKTEVAMRAAFIAIQNNRQVVILVPTTLLAQQHFDNFKDRFANWPINIELISRFRTAREQTEILGQLSAGRIDLIIGTHKLLQNHVKIPRLGLMIIDEEHRFGVQQKDKIKAWRGNVDVLTLTATPIPRTLNMSLSGLCDLSLMTTPPIGRLSIKTFILERNKNMIREAIMRELLRGGQIFYLHNDVASIEKTARDISDIVPEAKVAIAHGQMRERELELVMSQFYHLRFNVLVCTTIIETGIDIPTANTIVIDRADRFGLAQLHQLRGRVGRSTHQAYAYLLVPHSKSMTTDAKKRLDAFASLEDLGAGFTLASHDSEIRGAGELLGEEQSGQMQAIGFNLYMELLEKAVATLKEGKSLEHLETTPDAIEVDLHIPALIPETYVYDVHTRLILYKRMNNAKSAEALDELQIEMIDRFGLLPPYTKFLFEVMAFKITAQQLGIRKIDATAKFIRIDFKPVPTVAPEKIIHLLQTQPKRYQLDGPQRLKVNFMLDKVIDESQKDAKNAEYIHKINELSKVLKELM